MAEEKRAFDASDASLLVGELRNIFKSGRTKSYDWRISQLKGIEKMIEERENDVIEALQKDLSKPEFETFGSEVWLMSPAILFVQKPVSQIQKEHENIAVGFLCHRNLIVQGFSMHCRFPC